jgi:single-stranded DNA-binding protein
MEVTITGKIYEETWTDKEGQKRTSVEINADSIAVTTFTLAKDAKNEEALDSFPSWKSLSDIPF